MTTWLHCFVSPVDLLSHCNLVNHSILLPVTILTARSSKYDVRHIYVCSIVFQSHENIILDKQGWVGGCLIFKPTQPPRWDSQDDAVASWGSALKMAFEAAASRSTAAKPFGDPKDFWRPRSGWCQAGGLLFTISLPFWQGPLPSWLDCTRIIFGLKSLTSKRLPMCWTLKD